MNNKIKFLCITLAVLILQGCVGKNIPIKTQTSNDPKILACITNNNFNGKCNNDLQYDEAQKILRNNPSSDYFNVLSEINFPDKIQDNNLSNYISNKDFDGLNQQKYQQMFQELGCSNNFQKVTADITTDILSSETHKNIRMLLEKQLYGSIQVEEKNSNIEFKKQEFNTFLQDLAMIKSFDGFRSAQCGMLTQLKLENKKNIDYLIDDFQYIDEYFRAYFRHGKFLKSTMQVGKLYDKLLEQMKKEAPYLSDKELKLLAKNMFKKLTGKKYEEVCENGVDCEITVLKKLDDTKFITRAGVEHGFPHITVSFDMFANKKATLTQVDWNTIGAEVAIVFIEAIGDKLIGLPAAPSSTVCQIKQELCYPTKNDIGEKEFVAVNEYSDMINTYVSNYTGNLIRGAGWFSLNNEAIAKIVEASLGTIAKKAAEKVAYCMYSCKKTSSKGLFSDITFNETKVNILY